MTVYVRTPEMAERALAGLGRVQYRGARLIPERSASKNSIVLVKPIDDRASHMEVLHMVQYLVGPNTVEHLSLEKDQNNVTCAIAVFRNTEFTGRALKVLQGRTLYSRPLTVEHIVVPKRNATVNHDKGNFFAQQQQQQQQQQQVAKKSILSSLWSGVKSLFR